MARTVQLLPGPRCDFVRLQWIWIACEGQPWCHPRCSNDPNHMHADVASWTASCAWGGPANKVPPEIPTWYGGFRAIADGYGPPPSFLPPPTLDMWVSQVNGARAGYEAGAAPTTMDGSSGMSSARATAVAAAQMTTFRTWILGVALVLFGALCSRAAEADPATPLELVDVVAAGQSRRGVVRGDLAFIGLGRGVVVLGLDAPPDPRPIGHTRALDGTVRDVELSGDHLYVAAGEAGLSVFDVSAPDRPTSLTGVDYDGAAFDMALTGRRLYVADGARTVVGFDLADNGLPRVAYRVVTSWPAAAVAADPSLLLIAEGPPALGSGGARVTVFRSESGERLASVDVEGPGTPQQLAMGSDFAYLAYDTGGLVSLEISAPENPKVSGVVPTPSRANGLYLSRDTLLLAERAASGHAAVRTFSLSSDGSLHEAGSWEADRADPGGQALGIAANGDKAIVASYAGGVRVLRVEQPSDISEVGRWYFDTMTPGLTVAAGRLHLAGSSDGVHALDVGRAGTVELLGSARFAGSLFGDVVVADEHTLLMDTLGAVVNLRWPENGFAEVVGGFTEPFTQYRSLDVDGTTAFIGASDPPGARVAVIDLSDPANPLPRATVGGLVAARGVAVDAGVLYVADSTGGLKLFGIADPSRPSRLGSAPELDGAFVVAVEGRYAYVGTLGGNVGGTRVRGAIHIVDVADAETPVTVGSLELPGGAWHMALSDGIAYVASRQDGLVVVDATDPTSPRVAEHLDGVAAWAVAVDDGWLHVAARDGLRTYQVLPGQDPTATATHNVTPSRTPPATRTPAAVTYLAFLSKGREPGRTPDPTPMDTPTRAPSSTATPSLPDLVIAQMHWCQESGGRHVIDTCVGNTGHVAAGSFAVRITGNPGSPGGWGRVPGLEPEATACLPRIQPGYAGELIVDADDDVAEADETNNRAFTAVPTSPSTCAPRE